MRSNITKVAACLLSVAAVSAHAGEEAHADIEIGRDGSQLAVVEAPAEPILLEAVSGFINGWSAAEPGLFEIESVEDGLNPLDTLANDSIRLELVSSDAGFLFIQAGGFTPLDTPGDFAELGTEGGFVHSHPTWVIDSGVVGTDFEGTLSATFRLVDGNTSGYTASEDFTLEFTNVPEPSSAIALLTGAGLLATRRRRRA